MTGPVIARMDLVPALLTINYADSRPTYQVDGVRVIVTFDTVYVWRESGRGQAPELFLNERIADLGGKNTSGYWVKTDDGDVLHFRRSTGCACGGRIRSFRPFDQGIVLGTFPSE